MDRFEGDFMQLGTQMECKLRGKKIKSTNFCKLSRNKHYRINLQQAIWRKSSLDKVLDAANIYSTWDFEVFFIDDSYGQKLSRGFNAFFPKGYTFPIVNGMEKGIISYPAIELLDRFGRAYPPTRQIQTKQEYRKKHRYDCIHAVTPRFLRLFLKKVMKICGTKFLSKG